MSCGQQKTQVELNFGTIQTESSVCHFITHYSPLVKISSGNVYTGSHTFELSSAQEQLVLIDMDICDFSEDEQTNGKAFTIETLLFNN